ncbi:MAG TPA: ATP-dependent Clp protease ATP-binding subunit [Candidatus Dojkabacteria bacterium]|nr:ATP-dependent Clp protease ATP-binding subunit [Candidatus Dojkabacteria bacterium]
MQKEKKKENSVFSKLSDNAKESLKLAQRVSKHLFAKEVNSLHIFLGIILNGNSLGVKTLQSMGFSNEALINNLIGDVSFNGTVLPNETEEDINLSQEGAEILRKAFAVANRLSHVYVGSEHLLLAILSIDNELSKKLKTLGLDYKGYETALFNYATYPVGILSKPENMPNPSAEQSLLSVYGKDLVKEAEEGLLDPIVGREKEIDQMVNVLSRRKKNNPLIVGEAGVGKTALVEALAQRIADGNVPQSLKDIRIVSLDVASITAGSKMRGDIEEKMLAIIREVTSSPNIVIFIDEIHNVLNSGIPGMPSDMVGVLKPALTRGEFRCIGATTSSEYTKYMEEDDALVRRFQPIMVEEPSIIDTIKILKRIKPVLEAHHNIKISKEALETAVNLSSRYVTDRFLPDKAIDLLDEAAASKKLEVEKDYSSISDLMSELRIIQFEKEKAIKKGLMEEASKLREQESKLKVDIKAQNKKKDVTQKSKEYEVDIDTIKQVISKWTGIPMTTLGQNEKSSLVQLDKVLSKHIIGQKEAINVVSSAIKRARTGISSEDRPWASFLFLGPTGVGKTELAKVLTKELFGSEDKLIQIDMSELMEMHSVSKLIGSPPGYIGYREGGQLTEKVRQNPHSVILFDEIEKAHSDVLNILLQILEEGHLTDGKGRRVNFKNTVIILTSNIGAEQIKKDKVLGFVDNDSEVEKDDKDIENAYQTMKSTLTKELKNTIRPELLNRLDDIVIFRSLTQKDVLKIVDLIIKDLNRRLLTTNIKVDVTAEVKKYLVKEGFNEEYGARPLKRMVQDRIENLLANYILEHDFEEKELRTLKVDFVDNKIQII